MAKKVISMTLSQKSVQNVIKELRSYQNSLEYKCRLLAEKLAEKGVEIAQTYVASLDAISVSYTHLRAHETVLDIVCRLLLEKKNKENNKTIEKKKIKKKNTIQ